MWIENVAPAPPEASGPDWPPEAPRLDWLHRLNTRVKIFLLLNTSVTPADLYTSVSPHV